MTSEQLLERLQRWMQTVITHPDGIAAGIGSPQARREIDVDLPDIEQVIARSDAQTSIERLAIYGNAYYARLVGCLAAEFPATQQAVGKEPFSGFVFGYLQQSPSTSYTLGELGRDFPGYLAGSRPPRESDEPDWIDFLVDLSTLERTYSDVFDGPGEEDLPLMTADRLRGIPPGDWEHLRLQPAPSLQLLELRFPAHEYASAVRRGEEATIPAPLPTRLAINRREYIVRRRTLDPLPFDLLGRLMRGVPLGRAIGESLDTVADPPGNLTDVIEAWFRTWTAAGYFVGVETQSVTK